LIELGQNSGINSGKTLKLTIAPAEGALTKAQKILAIEEKMVS